MVVSCMVRSGHGVCDQASRQCMCEAFWMQDIFRKHFGDGDSNCGTVNYSFLFKKFSIL